ncbi:MAG: hypothetical protein RR585_11395 [Coprobacillus sp.]
MEPIQIILVFCVLLGALNLSYQVFKMTELDAIIRGLKRPKLWGIFALSGNNGAGGLLLYLIGRKRYPSTMSEDNKLVMDSRKKKAGLCLGLIALSTILLAASFTLLQ